MRFSLAAAAVLAQVLYVSAADHLIMVGNADGLDYFPSNITAAEGDTVSFQFTSKNHSVTQSSFAAPCTKLSGGVDSGFQAVAAGATQLPQWSITVNNASSPLWFFCAQTNPADHCAAGMVFSINATPLKTFAAFQAAAKLTASTASSGSSAAGASSSAAGAGGAGGATSAVGNTSGAGAATGAATSASSAATGAGTSSSGSTATGAPASNNGALRRGGSAAGILTFVGLLAGLIL